MRGDEAVKKTIKDWFSGLEADFWDTIMPKSSHDTLVASFFLSIKQQHVLRSVITI
jgi:hypothetical protein